MVNIYHSAADAPEVIPRNSLINSCFLEAAKKMPDKSVQLIIADPPYFEVKGEFDFIWENRDAYLRDVEIWAQECKRVLADNGTLFWWGMDKKIAYSQVVLDKYFNLINTLVWERPGLSSEWDTRRSFPERGMERVLMYAQQDENDKWSDEATGWEKIKDNPKCFASIKNYMRSERDKSGKSMQWFVAQTTTSASHYFANSQWTFPTEKDYKIFQQTGFFQKPYETLRQEYETLRQEYETLRQEYEAMRRPFNNFLKLTDVLKFPQQTNEHNHPTKKPIKLTRALIETCSHKGDLVLVPFGGSGTECEAAMICDRDFIATEISPTYFNDVLVPRIQKADKSKMPKLF